MKPWADFTFHCPEVDLVSGNAAAGDKLFFMGCLAFHFVGISVQLGAKSAEIFMGEVVEASWIWTECFPEILW